MWQLQLKVLEIFSVLEYKNKCFKIHRILKENTNLCCASDKYLKLCCRTGPARKAAQSNSVLCENPCFQGIDKGCVNQLLFNTLPCTLKQNSGAQRAVKCSFSLPLQCLFGPRKRSNRHSFSLFRDPKCHLNNTEHNYSNTHRCRKRWLSPCFALLVVCPCGEL